MRGKSFFFEKKKQKTLMFKVLIELFQKFAGFGAAPQGFKFATAPNIR
jgi:hypothetical protein